MDGHSNTGGWKDLVVGSVTTSIQKYDDEDTILITAGPIKKKAIIVDSEGKMKGREVGMYFSHTSTTKHYPFKSPLAQKIDNVQGLLHFKDINAITNGVYASYNDDRIVFYESSYNSKDFVAYVRPFHFFNNSMCLNPDYSLTKTN